LSSNYEIIHQTTTNKGKVYGTGNREHFEICKKNELSETVNK